MNEKKAKDRSARCAVAGLHGYEGCEDGCRPTVLLLESVLCPGCCSGLSYDLVSYEASEVVLVGKDLAFADIKVFLDFMPGDFALTGECEDEPLLNLLGACCARREFFVPFFRRRLRSLSRFCWLGRV